jgi:hypothetical protein
MAIGFTAELSHYTSTGTYATQAGIDATVGLPVRQDVPVPTVTPAFSLPLGPPGPHCGQCGRDETGDCVKYCVWCPSGVLPDGCVQITSRCPDGACCPSGQDACSDPYNPSRFCCPLGTSCCFPDNHLCCAGPCCFTPSGIGFCCPEGTDCFDGCCVTNTGGLSLTSNSNFLIANCGNCTYPNVGGNCQNNIIEGLKVSFQVGPEDMVAAATPYAGGSSTPNAGFTIQLNAHNPSGSPTNVMQYVFLISGDQIAWQVQYWGVPPTGGESDLYPLGGSILSSLPLNTVPAGTLFEIALTNEPTGSVAGGTFTVTDNLGINLGTAAFTVSQNFWYPIRAFEVDIVGPDNSQCAEFSSGGGTITYSTTSGQQLCAAGGLGVCSTATNTTCESSNATYGPIGPSCCGGELSQSVSFSTAITCPQKVPGC